MNLLPDETELAGDWISDGGRMKGDAVEQRITQLVAGPLEKVAVSPESGGWDVLYRDPKDGRYWELTYPRGEMHGGGPKRLTNISVETAISKYQDNSTGFLDLR